MQTIKVKRGYGKKQNLRPRHALNYRVSIALLINDNHPPQWTSFAKFSAHKQAISALAVLDDWIATGSSDATVKLWKLPQDGTAVENLQTISLSGRYPLALAFARLPQSNSLCALCP